MISGKIGGKNSDINRNLCVEVMVVKKKVTIAFVIIGILAISTMIYFQHISLRKPIEKQRHSGSVLWSVRKSQRLIPM